MTPAQTAEYMRGIDAHARRVASCYKQVDAARALFLGLLLIGHRVSLQAGEMFWALPGGERFDSATLLRRDPGFRVLNEPTHFHLAHANQRLWTLQLKEIKA